MNNIILVNGLHGVGLPAHDPSILTGYMVFETMRSYGTTIFQLGVHLNRLRDSAMALSICFPGQEVLRKELQQVWAPNHQFRIILTKGGSRIVQRLGLDLSRVGRSLTVASLEYEPTPHLLGSIKHTSRAGWLLAKEKLGVDEVMFVDHQGYILEANNSNVFAVINGVLRTPPTDGRILPGVTRQVLLRVAKEIGLDVSCDPLPRHMDFHELYLSSTLKELAPVSQLDGVAIGGGPIGERLLKAFRSLVDD